MSDGGTRIFHGASRGVAQHDHRCTQVAEKGKSAIKSTAEKYFLNGPPAPFEADLGKIFVSEMSMVTQRHGGVAGYQCL